LKPLAELGISDLSLSDDAFHHDQDKESPAKIARRAAERLGIPVDTICIEEPTVVSPETTSGKGQPVVGGGAMFRGRAVDKLAEGLPRKSASLLTSCPHEELAEPQRVHVDSYGHVHLCQGLSMGNFLKTPLSKLIANYNPKRHPICRALLKGGPVALALEYGVPIEKTYIDECHMCFLVRRALVNRFPEYLAPRQVYGLE
jgi:hypothetical protein